MEKWVLPLLCLLVCMHLKNELFYLCVLLERAKVIMALKNSSHLEQNLKEDFSLRIMQL